MIREIEPVLFVDPQQRRVLGFCERCGGECYSPHSLCALCREKP